MISTLEKWGLPILALVCVLGVVLVEKAWSYQLGPESQTTQSVRQWLLRVQARQDTFYRDNHSYAPNLDALDLEPFYEPGWQSTVLAGRSDGAIIVLAETNNGSVHYAVDVHGTVFRSRTAPLPKIDSWKPNSADTRESH